MQSYLIVTSDKQTREEKARELCKEKGIDLFDITYIERGEVSGKGEESKLKQSLGIDDVKAMQKKLYLKPLRGSHKAIIIRDAHLLTIEAQNALLKVLEEPPPSTEIMLTSETEDALLPTVRSRCFILKEDDKPIALTEEEKVQFMQFLQMLPKFTVGKALKEAEALAKQKDIATTHLIKLTLVAREKLLKESTDQTAETLLYVQLIRDIEKLRRQLTTTNVNARLALENFFLSLVPA